MARVAKLKVKLLACTKEPERNVTAAIRQCYAAVGAAELKRKTDEETRKRLIAQIKGSGHTSTLEHAVFTFAIEGVSRACTHQLVRHRIASYSQQSQRYVSELKGGMEYIVPPEIKKIKAVYRRYRKLMKEVEDGYRGLVESGIKPEDARFVLPNAAESKIVVTMNARALLNFFQERLCDRAQWEIRALAGEMLKLVKKAAPIIFAGAGPTCESQKICWEGKMSCGRWKRIKGGELRARS